MKINIAEQYNEIRKHKESQKRFIEKYAKIAKRAEKIIKGKSK